MFSLSSFTLNCIDCLIDSDITFKICEIFLFFCFVEGKGTGVEDTINREVGVL